MDLASAGHPTLRYRLATNVSAFTWFWQTGAFMDFFPNSLAAPWA
jgi:hypothetical protein